MKYKYWLDNTGLSNGKKNLLLEYFQTAEEVYRGTEETYQKIPQLKEEEIQRITKAKRKWDINEEYQKLAEGGVSVTFACDKNYPKKLKNIYQPPFALYYSGKLPGERLSVAIVGARRCSEYRALYGKKIRRGTWTQPDSGHQRTGGGDRRGRAGRSDQRRWRDLCGIRVRCRYLLSETKCSTV